MRLFTLISFLLLTTALAAQPIVAFETVTTGFNEPVDITGAGDGSGRLFVVEKGGEIHIVDQSDNSVLPTPFLNLSGQVLTNSERGLLGLAFAPDFATSGKFYVNYISDGTGSPSPGQTVISRFTVSPPGANVASIGTEEVILTISQPFANHNAGDLAFGPDGYLYVPTGDGGAGGDPQDNGQDPQALLGKMLRIDVTTPPVAGGPNYVIPADNPFVGNAAVRDEIWALGLRNPWRFSFDRQTGDMWIGDVGQNAREEINFQPASSPGGENYGWDCREGFIAYPENSGSSSPLCGNGSVYTDPIFDYTRNTTDGGFSVTGGFVYRGTRADDLLGWYVSADFAESRLFLLPPAGGRADVVTQNVLLSSISSFGEDDEGNLFVAEFGGTVSHVTTERTLPVNLVEWSATPGEKEVYLDWATASEESADYYRLERSTDGVAFAHLTVQDANGTTNQRSQYDYTDDAPAPGNLYYRLIQVDYDGTETIYPLRRVFFTGQEGGGPVLSPNPVVEDLTVTIPELQEGGPVSIRLFTADGRRVLTRHGVYAAGFQQFTLVLPELPAGIYRALISYEGKRYTRNLTIR